MIKNKINSLQEAISKTKITEQTSNLDHEVVRKKSRNYIGTTSLVKIYIPTYISVNLMLLL